MKNNLLLLSFLLVFMVFVQGTARAQTLMPLHKLTEAKEVSPSRPAAKSLSKSVESQWFFLRQIFQNATFSTPGNIITLFPDSTVLIRYKTASDQDTLDAPFYHSVGNIIDPRAGIFLGNPFNLTIHNPYSVDSFAMPYMYKRFNTDLSIVDTLVLNFFDNSAITNVQLSISPNTIGVGTILYNHLTNKPVGGNNKMEVKVLLTAADTAYGVPGGTPGTFIVNKYLSWPVGFNVKGGSRVGVTVTFVPGYEYSKTAPYDTLEADYDTAITVVKRLNQFIFVRFSYGELFNETSGTLLPAVDRIYLNGLYISTSIRGNNEGPNGWNGRYYPGLYSFAGGPFISTFVDMGLLITSLNVGDGKSDLSADGYGLGDAYPNPATGQDVTLDFSIAKTAPVTLTLSNVVGQTLKSATETFEAGKNSMMINTSDLHPGVYFYTLTSGTFSQTKKLTVTK